jgi:hypothetical protein
VHQAVVELWVKFVGNLQNIKPAADPVKNAALILVNDAHPAYAFVGKAIPLFKRPCESVFGGEMPFDIHEIRYEQIRCRGKKAFEGFGGIDWTFKAQGFFHSTDLNCGKGGDGCLVCLVGRIDAMVLKGVQEPHAVMGHPAFVQQIDKLFSI